jgi:hypothetical protein
MVTASPVLATSGRPGGGDDALASRDQQDLFDFVVVFGNRLTAGKDISHDGHGVGAAGPVDQILERRQSRPANQNGMIFTADDRHRASSGRRASACSSCHALTGCRPSRAVAQRIASTRIGM